jgi:hypothetical protein
MISADHKRQGAVLLDGREPLLALIESQRRCWPLP